MTLKFIDFLRLIGVQKINISFRRIAFGLFWKGKSKYWPGESTYLGHLIEVFPNFTIISDLLRFTPEKQNIRSNKRQKTKLLKTYILSYLIIKRPFEILHLKFHNKLSFLHQSMSTRVWVKWEKLGRRALGARGEIFSHSIYLMWKKDIWENDLQKI